MKQSLSAYSYGIKAEGDIFMLQEQERATQNHKLTMNNRGQVELTGVTEVGSFDNQVVELETTEGAVRFTGNDLNVKRLTLERGELELEGRVREIIYHESQKGRTAGGIISRLFR